MKLRQSAPQIVNPVEQLIADLSIDKFELSAAIGLSYPRTCAICTGVAVHLPQPILDLAETYRGPGAREKLASDWDAFRASQSTAVKRELEERFFPLGRCFGLQNLAE